MDNFITLKQLRYKRFVNMCRFKLVCSYLRELMDTARNIEECSGIGYNLVKIYRLIDKIKVYVDKTDLDLDELDE